MRKLAARTAAIGIVIGSALVAYAIGNGDIRANPEVTIITIASPTGSGSGTATLQNTASSTTYSVLVDSDASCDPALTFSVSGGNPVAIAPSTMRNVQLSCPPRGTAAMRRCLYHATNNGNGTALADFMTVCLYGSSSTVTPLQTSLDFGTVAVGDSTTLQLDLRNDGTQQITRVYLQTTDLAGNFQFSTPCNPDAPFCDEDITGVGQGSSVALQIKCTPQSPGVHTAELYVGTNTFQLLAQPVTLQCEGAATSAPVLGVYPTNIELQAPVEVMSGSATTTVHLTNIGGSTMFINDVRIVDVDSIAASDWTYTATGECSGQITSACSLDVGEQVDINLRFDPIAIGRRRATLLVSYKDTLDRTKEIPLEGIGQGATLEVVGDMTSIAFGSVPVGRSSTLDFKLENHGNRDAIAELSLSPGSTPPFTLTPATTALVTPGSPKTISITCAPTAENQFTTTVTAEAMDATGSPASVIATCEGSPLALWSNPTALNLGEIRAGGGEVRRTIQLLSTLAPTQLTLTGQPTFETMLANAVIGPLSQMTTPATFDIVIDPPLNADVGQISTNLVVNDINGEMLKIPVTGKIVRAAFEVKQTVELGTFCVGQPTTSSNVVLASTGTATIELEQPTLGLAPSPFQISNASPTVYPSSLSTGATATVSITPKRQNAATQLDDTVVWHTDVADKPSATTAISAKFVDQGGAIAPPALDFGRVTVHLYSEDGQRVVIQNCNPTPLQLDPPILKAPFQIDSPNFPTMLNPNERTTFSVGFHPTRIGVVTDTLRITSPQLPGTPLEVALVGEGVTTDELPPDAGTGSNAVTDTSFYACSCKSSRPSGVVPLLIAIALVTFRRRRGPSSPR
jgi:hypothetical protein